MSRRPSISVPKQRIALEPPPDDGEELVEISVSRRVGLNRSRPPSPRESIAPASPSLRRRARKNIDSDRSSNSRDEGDRVALNNPRDEARLLGEVSEARISQLPLAFPIARYLNINLIISSI